MGINDTCCFCKSNPADSEAVLIANISISKVYVNVMASTRTYASTSKAVYYNRCLSCKETQQYVNKKMSMHYYNYVMSGFIISMFVAPAVIYLVHFLYDGALLLILWIILVLSGTSIAVPIGKRKERALKNKKPFWSYHQVIRADLEQILQDLRKQHPDRSVIVTVQDKKGHIYSY